MPRRPRIWAESDAMVVAIRASFSPPNARSPRCVNRTFRGPKGVENVARPSTANRWVPELSARIRCRAGSEGTESGSATSASPTVGTGTTLSREKRPTDMSSSLSSSSRRAVETS